MSYISHRAALTKWNNLIQLFDLSQLVSSPTRVTNSTSTVVDHVYTSNKGTITECFVPHYAIGDHYLICFTRKVPRKISKSEDITTNYIVFKTVDELSFLTDLAPDLENFELHCETVNDVFAVWNSITITQLDRHTLITQRRVKSV